MESEIGSDQKELTFDTQLEVVEGNVAPEPNPEFLPIPDAFEQVLARYENERFEIPQEPSEPIYKNRVLIAAIFAFGGILLGRFAADPKVETKIVEKKVEVPVNVPQEKTEPIIAVKQPFRNLKNIGEFDPWRPLNGGLPLPPAESASKISGPITPMSPGDFGPMPTTIGGKLPTAEGKFVPLDPGQLQDTSANPDSQKVGENESKTPVAESSEKYVAMSLNGPAPESGQKSLLSIAGRFGGTGRTFTHVTDSGAIESLGAILIIPSNKYSEAKSAIEALGGASTDGEYEGLASRYQGSIQSIFTLRLAKLKDKRKDLLVDFMEDAQPVKQIDEAIDLETRAVSATRVGGNLKGKVVIRVLLK